jgi:hypothetical protein
MSGSSMTASKMIAIAFCFALASIGFVPAAYAGQWSERTEIRFNAPVEVPGMVLQPGTYWFVLSSDQSDRNIVEIFDAKQNKVYATLMTIPARRRHTTARTEIVLVKRHNSPDALWKWYYPGLRTGHQFTYPNREEARLKQDAKHVLFSAPMSSTNTGNRAG